MIGREKISIFFKSPKFAVVGASRNSSKFGYLIYTGLKKRNFSVIPVNPYADFIDGDACVADISQLNPADTALVLVTHRYDTDRIMQQAVDMGFKQIWVQTDCDTHKTPEYALNSELNVIFKVCILIVMRSKNIQLEK